MTAIIATAATFVIVANPPVTVAHLFMPANTQGILFQAVLYLVPDGGTPQGLLHQLVQLGFVADAVGTGGVGHVVVDAHGEGIWLDVYKRQIFICFSIVSLLPVNLVEPIYR